MGEFGDRLRRERELRGITLQEISESTKISPKSLEALEKEEFEALPGGVFNRGFVRSYARYVGLNPDEAIADYLRATQERSEERQDKFPLEIPETRESKGSPALNPRRPFWSIALAVAGLIAVLAYWTIHTRRLPLHSSPVKPPVAAPQSGISGNSAQPSSGLVSAGSPNGAVASEKPVGEASNGAASEVKNASKLPEVPAARAPVARTLSYTVAVTARSDSWVSIIADGRTIMEGVLDANQNRSVKFEKEMVLRTGNAGGLDVRYNGKLLGALGADNQVRTLRFPPRAPAQ